MKTKFIFILILVSNTLSYSQISKMYALTDLDSLEQLIITKHVNPFWINSKEDFELTVSQARSRIMNMTECNESCLVEYFKVIAAIGDGHSAINGNSRYELFGYFPLSLRWFDGELRVMRTIDKYKSAIGSKIVAVDGMPLNDVMERLKMVIPQANIYRFQKFVGSYLHLPGLLYGLGITNDPNEATFSFQKNNKVFKFLVKNLPPEEEENSTFISYIDGLSDRTWYQRNTDDYYWYDYDKTKKVFYFQYNRVSNMKSESSSTFATSMWNAVDSLEVDKFVLDLRYNGGGNFAYSLRYIQGILDRPKINQRGKLFIITGFDTFSAAMEMLNILEMKSQAIIVGEHPCDRPSRPGDAVTHTLPQTGIKINLSSLYHPSALLLDKRITNSLDQEIITTWDHYKSKIDPVINYIYNFKEESRSYVDANLHPAAIGSYDYSPTRDIRIKDVNGFLWMEIAHALNTPLYYSDDGKYKTEIPGMTVEIGNMDLTIYSPDCGRQYHMKVSDSRLCPVDFLYNGKMIQGQEIYKNIKLKFPTFIETKDHSMSSLANLVFFDKINDPSYNAGKIAKEILELGIELNNGNAPFCEYSLRFYK